MKRVGLVTCLKMPEPDPDEEIQLQSIRDAGGEAKLIAWDDKWFYMEQKFVKDDFIVASAIVRATFIKSGKRLEPLKVLKAASPGMLTPPEFPQYLKDLVQGEEEFLNYLKAQNRSTRQ